MSMSEIFGEPISVYTRAQALEDGELVDVTEWASADKGFIGGFTVPVALTRSLWGAIESIPASLKGCADVRGRAHDVLWMGSLAARRASGEGLRYFKLTLPTCGSRKRVVVLAIHSGPGDEGEYVITLGFPEDF